MSDAEAHPLRATLVLTSILCVGAFLRLYQLDLMPLYDDLARDVSIASNIAAGKNFPLLGPLIGPSLRATHAFLGPLYFYLLAIPFLFTQHPMAGYYFIALSNIAALFLGYRFAKAFFGRSVALTATALFAVFPLAVLSSRAVSNHAFLPLFTILFMRALYGVVVNGQSKPVIVMFAALGVLVQLHMMAVSLGAIALLAFLVVRPKVRAVDALIGLALCLLLLAPYLWYEFAHHFENTGALAAAVLSDQRAAGPGPLLDVTAYALLLFLPAATGLLVEGQGFGWLLTGSFVVLSGVVVLFFGAGVLLCVSWLLRHRGKTEVLHVAARRRIGLLLLWLMMPILMMGMIRQGSRWYYLDVLYPSQFIVIAMALSWLGSCARFPLRMQQGLAKVCAGLVVAVVVCQGSLFVALMQRIDRRGDVPFHIGKTWFGSAEFLSRLPRGLAGTITFLPMRYAGAMARALWVDFGLDEADLPDRVHWAVPTGGKEEELFRPLMRHLAAGTAADRATRAGPDVQYVVTRVGRVKGGLDVLRSKRIGPYLIVEYRPRLDSES